MGRHHAYIGTPIGREMEAACTRIYKMMQQTATLLTEYPLGIDQTLPMLFSDDDLAKARAANGVVVTPHTVRSYRMGPNTSLSFNFESSYALAMRSDRLSVNQSRVAPLQAYIASVEAIYLQFEQVKGVMRWLNNHATLGAIRYYFPTAMKLCPETFAGMDVPSRHGTPAGVHDWLQVMRDAAATVASAAMIPKETEGRKQKAMWLTFDSRTVQVGDTQYSTDQATFNL